MEKRHTMLCRLAVEITTEDECQRQCGVDATGMLNMYPRCVLEGYYAFIAHLRVHQQSVVGITLFVSTQGCGRPQTADEQKVDTHVFRCVVNLKQYYA